MNSDEKRNILTVIIRDDSPIINFGDSPKYRHISVPLTSGQQNAICLRQTSVHNGIPVIETISSCFIEDDTSFNDIHVHNLPITKDGVRFVPGMGTKVYHPDMEFVDDEGKRHGHPVGWDNKSKTWKCFDYHISECYVYCKNAGKEPSV